MAKMLRIVVRSYIFDEVDIAEDEWNAMSRKDREDMARTVLRGAGICDIEFNEEYLDEGEDD
ncbi:MAG: hypothetical protein P4L67_05180 [Candidatus Pacebacteria bacterium]|nr:hypothetical protein [Candidatus Paceibacterota bacterium]